MGNFVPVQVERTDLDHLNRNHIVRVQADEVAADDWVVKVLLSTGLEIVDSRHPTRDAAATRVADLVS